MNLLKFRKSWKAVLFVFLSLYVLYATFQFLTVGQRGGDTQLVLLANSFLQWNIDLPRDNLPKLDIANYYNNYYVYFGPLASILLIPFVFIFGPTFPQVSVGIFSLTSSFILIYFVSRHFKFEKLDSLYLSLFFTYSTVLFSSSVVNVTAWQVEALGVPLMLASILLYLKKKNAFLIGIFIGLSLLTRPPLLGVAAFFFFEMLQKRFNVKQFAIMLIPVIICLGFFGAYNERRFHAFLETGYAYNISKEELPIGANREYGEISIMHVPANLYSFLIMSPLPLKEKDSQGFVLEFPYMRADAWGVAIWFTSPLFLYLIFHFKKGKYSLSAGLAALILAIPVLTWYSVGFAQFGYRYALDFLPFLFLLLIPCLDVKLSKVAIILIIFGVLFNTIYAGSIFGNYPVFGIYSS